MPVNSTHVEYAKALPKWGKCRAAVAGQDAVHALGDKILPKLEEQDQKEYDAYKCRALYYNATGRTLDGLTGLIFRQPPQVEVPEAISFALDDVDTAGTPLQTLCEKAVEDLQAVGRFGLLTDYTRSEGARTQAEEQAAGLRPYLVKYSAESIINWRSEKVGNRWQLTLVVLHEMAATPKDPYESVLSDRWRVLRLEEGKYRVELWKKPDAATGGDQFVMDGEPVYPQKGGRPLDFIPFLICGPMGVSEEVAKPPLMDLVEVNLSHYRTTADYEHGLHFTGLPTPVIIGHTFSPGESLALGSTKAIGLPNAEAKAEYLEFEGKGLEHLSKRLEEKEQMMVALGARMLASEKRAAEAAETASIHRAGENSVLASLANAAGAAISKALTWAAEWAAAAGEAKVVLNTDFLPGGLSAQEIDSLVKAWQGGAISHETLYDNLQRGEIAQQGVSFADETERIASEPPKLGATGDGDGE
ncbi:MAG TPA: DUF4055 domain-containing protein [Solimonas sp.]